MNLGIAHQIRLQRFLNWQNHGNECNHFVHNTYINSIFFATFFNKNFFLLHFSTEIWETKFYLLKTSYFPIINLEIAS